MAEGKENGTGPTIISLKQDAAILKDTIKLERMKYADTTCELVLIITH